MEIIFYLADKENRNSCFEGIKTGVSEYCRFNFLTELLSPSLLPYVLNKQNLSKQE